MSYQDLLQRIRAEFLEMPGLHLTPAQARRLWSLEAHVCDQLLGALEAVGFLTRTRHGAFVRAWEGRRGPAVASCGVPAGSGEE